MRILISVLLTAALISLANSPAAQIKNSTQPTQATAERMKQENTELPPLQTGEVKTTEATAQAGRTAGEETETESKPEPVAVTPPPVKAEKPKLPKQGCETYRSLVASYNWDTRIAMAVMQAENQGCHPNVTSPVNKNGSVDRGLFQINSVHSAKVGGNLDRLYDPETNVKVAYAIYTESGWKAWSTFKAGKHLKFL